ncbi:hypothetical protein CRYUN_Cryun37aG0111100 [Craigia yunnanensis]
MFPRTLLSTNSPSLKAFTYQDSIWREPGRAEADFGRSDAKTVVDLRFCRSFDEDFGITDPIVKVPALLIMGCKDYVFKFPGMEEYIKFGKAKELVPDFDIIYLVEGTYFVQEQSPELVIELILDFLKSHILTVSVCEPMSKIWLVFV